MKELRSTYPEHHLLNPRRKYTNAASTNLQATFERIRAEQAAKQVATVTKIRKVKP